MPAVAKEAKNGKDAAEVPAPKKLPSEIWSLEL